MKKLIAITLAVVLAAALSSCGATQTSTTQNNGTAIAKATTIATTAAKLDLTGNWKQEGGNSADMYHIATVSDNTIEIYWYTASTKTKSLYWAGNFDVPENSGKEFKIISKNDKTKTGGALLASGDDTKEITYKDGKLIYSASAMGTTTEITLSKNK